MHLHHSALDCQPDSNQDRRPHEGGDRRRSLCPAVKVGLQFKRRFWEEDEAIYGGISYTDLPIRQIAYPNSGFNRNGPGVLLGAYVVEGANSFEFTSRHPAERVARAVELGSIIHPQYAAEFENGIAVAWHRVPFARGCAGYWTEKTRSSITRTCVRSRAGSCWRVSMRLTFQCGKEANPFRCNAIERLHLRVTKA